MTVCTSLQWERATARL